MAFLPYIKLQLLQYVATLVLGKFLSQPSPKNFSDCCCECSVIFKAAQAHGSFIVQTNYCIYLQGIHVPASLCFFVNSCVQKKILLFIRRSHLWRPKHRLSFNSQVCIHHHYLQSHTVCDLQVTCGSPARSKTSFDLTGQHSCDLCVNNQEVDAHVWTGCVFGLCLQKHLIKSFVF